MKGKGLWILIGLVAAWWIFFRRPPESAPVAQDQPLPVPQGGTVLEQTAAAVPPGTPLDMTGTVYEPPLKA